MIETKGKVRVGTTQSSLYSSYPRKWVRAQISPPSLRAWRSTRVLAQVSDSRFGKCVASSRGMAGALVLVVGFVTIFAVPALLVIVEDHLRLYSQGDG